MSRAALFPLFVLMVGCGPSTSGVDPAKTYENITDAEVDALCEWQERVLGAEPIDCGWEEDIYFDYASCVASGPLAYCGFHTVEQFEDCRRAWAEDPCREDHRSCFVPACA